MIGPGLERLHHYLPSDSLDGTRQSQERTGMTTLLFHWDQAVKSSVIPRILQYCSWQNFGLKLLLRILLQQIWHNVSYCLKVEKNWISSIFFPTSSCCKRRSGFSLFVTRLSSTPGGNFWLVFTSQSWVFFKWFSFEKHNPPCCCSCVPLSLKWPWLIICHSCLLATHKSESDFRCGL